MNKILAVTLIGSLMAAGLVLVGCDDLAKCIGNGECTVTIDQGTSGLYVDSNSPRSSCGKSATWDSNSNGYIGGCKVQKNIDGYSSSHRTYGTHGCDC